MLRSEIYTSYKASEQQLLFWLKEQTAPGNAANNVVTVTKLTGNLNIEFFTKAFSQIVNNVPLFHSGFNYENGNLVCSSLLGSHINLKVEDGRSTSESLIWSSIRTFALMPFDLNNGPLFRGMLVSCGSDSYWLVIVAHHSVIDLHTTNAFRKALSNAYNALLEGHFTDCLLSGTDYENYIAWYQNWVNSPDCRRSRDFWATQYPVAPDVLDFPYDFPRPSMPTSTGSIIPFVFEREFQQELDIFCHNHSTDPFLVLLSCYILLLKRYTNQDDLSIGVPFTNRILAEHRNVMGCLMNILPIRIRFDGKYSFFQLLNLVRKQMLLAHRNQSLPFTEILKCARGNKPPQKPGKTTVYQTLFTFEIPDPWQLHKISNYDVDLHPGGAKLDFSMIFRSVRDTLAGYFEYNTSIVSKETAARFVACYQELVKNVVKYPDNRICDYSILPREEYDLIVNKWNDTKRDYPLSYGLHELVELQVERSPNAVAIEMDGEDSLTYREFNSVCNQLAHYLVENGVGCGDKVGVYLQRSMEMVIALHAILKAGAVYVPLEPKYPNSRICQMIEDSEIKILITSQFERRIDTKKQIQTVTLDEIHRKFKSFPESNLGIHLSGNCGSYIIFTSGSTGNPKGVLNHHQGICNRILWMQEQFQLDSSDVVLQKTPFTFDVSVWEFFWPFICGARLAVAPPDAHRDPGAIWRQIRKYNVSTLHFVPSMLEAFLGAPQRERNSSLKRIISSGETLSRALQDRCTQLLNAELHNLYGPTEAAVDVTHWQCRENNIGVSVPIGRPIANTQIYILDSGMKPAPIGVPGELHIGGVQVATGYVNNPELTKKLFIPDLFRDDGSARLYKTGDWARYKSDGTILFIGRMDGQVKLHGQRIELEEINVAIIEESNAVQIAHTIMGEPGPDKKLVSYIVLKQDKNLDKGLLREKLERKLPIYMVPEHFVILSEIPLSPNGKLDRKRLPAVQIVALDSAFGLAPTSEKENKILDIWRAVLQLDDIGIERNFFDMGGNSLLAAHLVNRLNEQFNQALSIFFVFMHSTIQEQAKNIDQGRRNPLLDFESIQKRVDRKNNRPNQKRRK